MSKFISLVTNLKIAKIQFWWPEVAWFNQILVFKTDYDKIEP